MVNIIVIWVVLCVVPVEGLKGSQYIVGGRESKLGRMPWIVSIDSEEHGFVCGGTLITPYHVLTAAHCVYDAPEEISVSFGGFNRSKNDFLESMKVSSVITHERFNPSNPRSWDVALLRLPYAVTRVPGRVEPVTIANILQDFRGSDDCWIGGWGRTVPREDAPISPVLHERNITTLTLSECRMRWRESLTQPRVTRQHLCVDDEDGNVSACQGDSGSPLVCEDEGELFVAGISSWGSRVCQVYPSVYTRVSFFFTWIINQIDNDHLDKKDKLWPSQLLKKLNSTH